MQSTWLLLLIFGTLSFCQRKGTILGFNTGQDEPSNVMQLAAKKYGATWTRLWEDEWAWQSNPDDYAKFEKQAQYAKQNGMKVLAVCVGAPSSKSGVNDPNSDKYPPLPQYYQDFAQYCAGFVRHGADAVEVWNEPNNDGFWRPSGGGVDMGSSTVYANLLIATYPVVKATNPNAIVVSAGLSPGGYYNSTKSYDIIHAPLHYAERLFQVPNFKNSFDAFGVHPYMYGNGATPNNGIWGYNVWAQIPWFYGLLEQNGVGNKPLWFTEVGCPSKFDGENEANQTLIFSQYLSGIDSYRQRNKNMVGLFIIYEFIDNSFYQNSAEGWFGILRSDLSEKPSAPLVSAWSFSNF